MPENLRTIKKDINYLIDELLFDCLHVHGIEPRQKSGTSHGNHQTKRFPSEMS